MSECTAIRRSDHRVILNRVTAADTFWPRFKGLMGRKAIARDEGLLLKPCSSIHMMFMKFPIDAAFLDRDSKVLAVAHSLKPWRSAPLVRGTRQVLEAHAGSLEEAGLAVGDVLEFREIAD